MRHDPDALMLFAAGFGTRMRPLTDTRPKPLIPVAGKPLIDHALALAEGAGLRRIVANAHYLSEQVEAHLAPLGVPVSVERPEILDTGGGLRAALPRLSDGPVLTLNTDAVWTGPNPLITLRQTWDPTRMEALLLLVPPDRATGRAGPGDFTLHPDGGLTRGGDMVYVGAQALVTDDLANVPQPAFSLNLLWDRIAARGRLFGVLHPGGWCDVGRPEGIALAEDMLRAAQDA